MSETKEKVFKKVRVDEREQEWLDAFTKAGYTVTMSKNHIDMKIKGAGITICLQKNTIPNYITFTSEEQLAGLEKIYGVKKYGYTVAMPKKQSDKGDKRFRAVSNRADNEIDMALELVAKIIELKAKTKPVKEEKKQEEKKPATKKSKKEQETK